MWYVLAVLYIAQFLVSCQDLHCDVCSTMHEVATNTVGGRFNGEVSKQYPPMATCYTMCLSSVPNWP